jgi:iron complex outermembrane receptor protein
VDLSVGYTHARYTEDVRTGPTALIVKKGTALDGPPWTVALGVQYDFDLIGDSTYIRADYQHASKLKASTRGLDPTLTGFNRRNRIASGYDLVNMRIGALMGGVNASVFVDNLFDRAPLISPSRTGVLLIDQTVRPRTVGMTVAYRY